MHTFAPCRASLPGTPRVALAARPRDRHGTSLLTAGAHAPPYCRLDVMRQAPPLPRPNESHSLAIYRSQRPKDALARSAWCRPPNPCLRPMPCRVELHQWSPGLILSPSSLASHSRANKGICCLTGMPLHHFSLTPPLSRALPHPSTWSPTLRALSPPLEPTKVPPKHHRSSPSPCPPSSAIAGAGAGASRRHPQAYCGPPPSSHLHLQLPQCRSLR